MMVLTAFHMLSFTDNVSGDDVSVGSAVDRPTTHSQRRLTISNIGAKEPASMTDPDGNLHLAWVDITEHGEVLCWKRSSDNARSFTSDKAISSGFLSIRNISMTFIEATDDVVIVFEGKMDEEGPFMVYLLMSQNGQRSWGQLYALGEGAGPTVLAIDRDLFISLTSLEQGRNVFSIIKASIIDSRLQGATSIISFPVDAKVGEMVSLGDRIHYASYVRDGTNSFVYGQIDRMGNRLFGPSAVLKTGMEINEFVLMDEQAFLFYLNCSDSKGQFVKGLNVIIVPRAVVLASELNYTLFNLDKVGQGHPLYGAGLSVTNKSAEQVSAHVIAVISKNVTASHAEAILDLLTRDVNGVRVGNGVSVTSSQMVMMHLPLDVLNYVPLTGIQSSPTGNRPVGWHEAVFNSIMDAAEFLANGIIALGTFMIDVFVTIAEIGLSFLVKLANDVAQAVKEVAQAIVDAFCAFVDWAVEFIKEVFNAAFGPMIDAIKGLITGFQTDVRKAASQAVSDYESTGSLSGSTLSLLYDVIVGDLFWFMLGVIVVIEVAMMVITAATAGMGFLIQMAIALGVSVLIEQALGSYKSSDSGSDSFLSTITSFINNIGDDISALLTAVVISLPGSMNDGAPEKAMVKGSSSSYAGDVWMAVACLTIDIFAMIASGASFVSELTKVTGKATLGIVMGFMGCVLSFVSFVASAAENLVADLVTSTCGVLLGIISILCGVFDMVKINIGMKSFAGFSLAMGFFSTTLSGFALRETWTRWGNSS